MTSIFTLSRTQRSQPVAFFMTYAEANAYNAKFYDGLYVVQEHVVTKMAV